MKPTIEQSYCYNHAVWNRSLDSNAVFVPPLQFDSILDSILVISIGAVIVAIVLGLLLVVLARRGKKAQPLPSPLPTAETARNSLDETLPSAPASLADEDTQVSLPTLTEMLDETTLNLPEITTVGEPNVLPVSGQRPPTIGWQIASLTDVGLKREINEDNMLMWEAESDELGAYGLYVVADGLGGHVAGEIASQLAVDAIQQRLETVPPLSASGQNSLEEWLKETAKAANEAILRHQQEDDEVKKMGSTVVMALLTGRTARVINVGDSRAYRLNHQKIEQISTDHSLVERLVQIGQITREEARTHKQRNVIYSTLGEKQRMEIGYYEIELSSNDRLLLCSDGLSEKVPDELMLYISRSETDLGVVAQLLVEAAKQAGGDDNITVVMIQLNEGASP